MKPSYILDMRSDNLLVKHPKYSAKYKNLTWEYSK